MNAVTVNDDGLVLRLYIQPKASRDSIVGLHGDEVKVAITAPPVDGQANSHLVKFLGKQFRVACNTSATRSLWECRTIWKPPLRQVARWFVSALQFLVRVITLKNKELKERHEYVDFPAFNGH